jgi:membrane-bound lytic murein transglycosylase B
MLPRLLRLLVSGIACLIAAVGAGGAVIAADAWQDQVLLAQRYDHGEGVERDAVRAMQLLCQAADAGSPDAAYHIGWRYYVGHGVARDDTLAARWLATAAARGQVQAKNIIERFHLATSDPSARCVEEATPADLIAPQKIASLVGPMARQYGLDPRLVLAVIKTESGFNPLAVSPKGAVGLMQLMPATAQRFAVTNAFDIRQNLAGGMKYLRWLLSQFGGDVILSLAAYNAGEQRVAEYNGVPPFAETHTYIDRVRVYYPRLHHP